MTPPPPQRSDQGRAITWIQWIGAGLTATLAVLFVVAIQRLQEQNQSLRQLEQRLQVLENARALERTNALEQQLRATVERVHGLEDDQGRVADLARAQQQLADQVQRLQSLPPGGSFDGLGLGGEIPPGLRTPSARSPAGRPPSPRPVPPRPGPEPTAPGPDQL
ncbi:hypothetical protein [Cyanobium sp. ATX 6F1]|uniref:hypothetical protein n=1 Tax=Cyanobium sp. ATX 6F1 TaxID=2823702 RepID=UPI0020CF7AE4|nr:hypothetical protein [Cyanobium sp. ATX 6F1]MCP9915959.1 hypothetical protein [Cyanobium sp. ATX 6F1]